MIILFDVKVYNSHQELQIHLVLNVPNIAPDVRNLSILPSRTIEKGGGLKPTLAALGPNRKLVFVTSDKMLSFTATCTNGNKM